MISNPTYKINIAQKLLIILVGSISFLEFFTSLTLPSLQTLHPFIPTDAHSYFRVKIEGIQLALPLFPAAGPPHSPAHALPPVYYLFYQCRWKLFTHWKPILQPVLWWVISNIVLNRLREIQMVFKTLILGMLVRAFLEVINIRFRRWIEKIHPHQRGQPSARLSGQERTPKAEERFICSLCEAGTSILSQLAVLVFQFFRPSDITTTSLSVLMPLNQELCHCLLWFSDLTHTTSFLGSLACKEHITLHLCLQNCINQAP